MKKPDDPKKGEVIPFAPRGSQWNQIRRLTKDADAIRQLYDALGAVREGLRERNSNEPPPDIGEAQLGASHKAQIARCRAWLHDIDRGDYYEPDEDDGRPVLSGEVISQRLGVTVGVLHSGGSQNLEVFLPLLLEHVCDAEITYLALQTGCWEIEQKKKFLAISEVLEVLNQHEVQWNARKRALREIEERSKRLQDEIGKAQTKYEAERGRYELAKRLTEINLRLGGSNGSRRQYGELITAAQERGREAYREVERYMPLLVEAEQQFDEAMAALDAAIAAAKAAGMSDAEITATGYWSKQRGHAA